MVTPVDALAQLSFVVQQQLQRRAAAHDLSMIQTRLLGVLRDRTPTMKELGILLDLDKSSISGLIDRAVARDLVAKRPDPADRRSTRVSLTDTGREIGIEVAGGFGRDMENLLAPLSERQVDIVTDLIGRILPN
jgi:MarR family transcriptional regulator, lower aerobic nicotinate degradation pathway regulator